MDILKVKLNGEWVPVPAIVGPRGIGIQSITKTSTSGIVDTYTITFSDTTTTTFEVSNGAIPNFTIGTVIEGQSASATITGTAAEPILNLVLPAANVMTKADKTDTVLETTLSRGRAANTTVGAGSFAFGDNVTASGAYSHAEGRNTNAVSQGAHAEGLRTEAHYAAHAEGESTVAEGQWSHAEGLSTQAIGAKSHAEGEHTIANATASHVVGRYN